MYLYILLLVGILSGLVILTKVWRLLRRRHYDVSVRDVSKGHRWVITDMFSQPTYCNISGEPILHGSYCDSCGICVTDECIVEANNKLPCKELSNSQDKLRHHWVRGNLPLSSQCCVCQEECGNFPELCDLNCIWCSRTVHDRCVHLFSRVCDLGPHAHFIVPPNCVRLKQVGIKGRRHPIVKEVVAPSGADWRPLIVIANRKSGNGDGEHILQSMRRQLNPAQVVDLADMPPEAALEWCHLVPNVTCHVLAAGGDGTVGWILSAIDKLKLQPCPYVCILPLGTGNDLARVLGWGGGHTADVDIQAILEQMKRANVVSLDRWKVCITPAKHFGFRMPKKIVMMNNYASVGVDALVTLDFHRQRESYPSLFGSRIINKFWYFTYGTKDVLMRACKNLHVNLTVELDGREIPLPEIEGVVVLNIASWGGGCRPWGDVTPGVGDVPAASYSDGMVEVFALYSSFHIAQLQVGLAEPLRLGQAKRVRLRLSGGVTPMQVDGEPWEQHAGTIDISLHNQVNMLARTEDPQG